MDDLISRQAAIDAVEKSMYENPHENEIHRGMHDHEHRHFLTILMGLPSAQPEPHWIPCSERLPEESGKYFVTVLYGIGKRTTSAPYHLRSKSWALTGRMAYWKVIAWMPLPEPYKGGDSE